jgi:enterochelin esterase-like enzyme
VEEVPYIRSPDVFPALYTYGPDSYPQPGVPSGTISEFAWSESQAFPGTTRRYWVYVPAGYDDSVPASLMVFQDGHVYLDPKGIFRTSTVFDNLAYRGEIPTVIGVFIDPVSRNAEYDAFNGRYADFLLNEILPAVRANYSITDDPNRWAICGGSSGGNCALTVAWHRPEYFRRVVSMQGSFVQIPGGNPYPHLIETTPPKPLRIFMSAESRDLNWNEPEFNWFSSNLRVAAALAERGYDVRLVVGDAEHTLRPGGNHGAVILPDALRWLWRIESA